MSEGGTPRKTIKLRMNSSTGITAFRGGASGTNTPKASNSRAASPAPTAPAVSRAPKATSPAIFEGMPTEEEIKDKIPAEGISVKDLLNRFGLRGKGEKTDAFSKLLRKVSTYERDTKLLKPMRVG